jgi:hypothetical protein
MSETKWTPGPWRLNEWNHVVGPNGKEIRCTGLSLAGGNIGMDEPEANDRLIAAAPDLYAALADIVDVMDRLGGVQSERMNRARRALARARGEEPSHA